MGITRKNLLRLLTLVLILCWTSPIIPIYGDKHDTLLYDKGENPGGWTNSVNQVRSAESLDDGPSYDKNHGKFYYFTDSRGKRDISEAWIYRIFTLNDKQKTAAKAGNLYYKFQADVQGWDDDFDVFRVWVYYIDSTGSEASLGRSNVYTAGRQWRTQIFEGIKIPKDIQKLKLYIEVQRRDGSDLDLYLDNIYFWLWDKNDPLMEDIIAKEIIDVNNKSVKLKENQVNWVNTTDIISGTIEFDEAVAFDANTMNLITNLVDKNGTPYFGNAGAKINEFSESHSFKIAMNGLDRVSEGEYIQLIYKSGTKAPFTNTVKDTMGHTVVRNISDLNITKYRLKLDTASPVINTPENSFAVYSPGRTAVELEINEKDGGVLQSPLTLTYQWRYKDYNGNNVEGKKTDIDLSGSITPVRDSIGSTYKVSIDIPNGENIPPYQEFLLYAEVKDEARNPFDGRIKNFRVNQRDATAPVVSWEKSIHGNGTEVDLQKEEDVKYAQSRKVVFSAQDAESGIDEIRYVWTREPINVARDSFVKVLTPGENGKYTAQATAEDTPLEGIYYLNILAVNGANESAIVRKGFYFDNQGPAVSGGLITVEGKPHSAEYLVKDRALQDKFLYTILTKDMVTGEVDPLTLPDISGGIKDNGAWRALELRGEGIERIARLEEIFKNVEYTRGYYLVTRFYDEVYNCTEYKDLAIFDFDSPEYTISEIGTPEKYEKNHTIKLEIKDELSAIDYTKTEISWINANSGEIFPVSLGPNVNDEITVTGSTDFNGVYNLRIHCQDIAGNVLDRYITENGKVIGFYFDNTSPTVDIHCDTKAVVNQISFEYNNLNDTHSGIDSFEFGITQSKTAEPQIWENVALDRQSGVIIYPNHSYTDGEWYLIIKVRDKAGNVKAIRQTEAFLIDIESPSGKISFGKNYTNTQEVTLQLEIDELLNVENKAFKTLISHDLWMVDENITTLTYSSEQSTPLAQRAWQYVTYQNGKAHYSYKLPSDEEKEYKLYARFMDEAGNFSEIYNASIILDTTAPTGLVSYDITEPTKENVTATVTFDNSDAMVLNNRRQSTYTFTRNGEFDFILSDEAGNMTRVKAEVNNIDRKPPKATVIYSHPRDQWTQGPITAQLQLEDANGSKILNEDKYTFEENGEYLFEFEDGVGNYGSILAKVANIDSTPLESSIIYIGSETAPVTAYLSVNKPVKVLNNGGSFRRVFEKNESFTFRFEDITGKEHEETAVVETITYTENYTEEEKYIGIEYSDSGKLTKNAVSVEFIPVTGLSYIINPTVTEAVYESYTHSFTENDDFSVTIKILDGAEEVEERTVKAGVTNIDTAPPEAEVFVSTKDPTNQDVSVMLVARDDRSKDITYNSEDGTPYYIFDRNGVYSLSFLDEAGNEGTKVVEISNIDKTPPKGVVEYQNNHNNNTVTAMISFPGDEDEQYIEILNNSGSREYEFVENGVFRFEFADPAGNKGEAAAVVTSLSKTATGAVIEYYIDGKKIDNPNESPTNKSITAKLTSEGSGGSYTVINNGGSSSYTFEQNGAFTFEYKDANNNKGYATAAVASIDKSAPRVRISADNVKPTNKDVTITVVYSDDKGIAGIEHNMEAEYITSSEGRLTYICKSNKTIRVKAFDAAGNETIVEYVVDNIDKQAPIATIEYDIVKLTNNDVVAELRTNEGVRILNNNGSSGYVFKENGSFTFIFEDYAGNPGSIEARVDWIDKVAPSGSLEYSSKQWGNKPVTVTLKTDPDAIILNNGGLTQRIFYTSGTYTFRIADAAGNITELKAEVWNIDDVKPEIVLKGDQYVCIPQGETYTEQGYTATDNIDGDVTKKVAVEGSVDSQLPGIYTIKYKLSDAAGNIAETTRTVRVVSPSELILTINGRLADSGMLVLDTRNVTLGVLGDEGGYTAKWAEGRRTQSYFKANGNALYAGIGNVWLDNYKWYTFFVQDKERRTQTIQVYISE